MQQYLSNTNALVQGMYDVEAREEILYKEPQLVLAATVLFIEGKVSTIVPQFSTSVPHVPQSVPQVKKSIP